MHTHLCVADLSAGIHQESALLFAWESWFLKQWSYLYVWVHGDFEEVAQQTAREGGKLFYTSGFHHWLHVKVTRGAFKN